MTINGILLPDPVGFTIDNITGVNEVTLLSGDRRYVKFDKIKKNIRMTFWGIDDETKETIEDLALSPDTLTLNLDNKNYTVVSFTGPTFERIKGPRVIYQCSWELREV